MLLFGFSIPYAVLLLQGYFQTSCPPELEKAGLIDGCTWFTAFLRDFIGEFGLNRANAFMVACTMATIPSLLMFSLLQRWMVSGIASGSVKG